MEHLKLHTPRFTPALIWCSPGVTFFHRLKGFFYKIRFFWTVFFILYNWHNHLIEYPLLTKARDHLSHGICNMTFPHLKFVSAIVFMSYNKRSPSQLPPLFLLVFVFSLVWSEQRIEQICYLSEFRIVYLCSRCPSPSCSILQLKVFLWNN